MRRFFLNKRAPLHLSWPQQQFFASIRRWEKTYRMAFDMAWAGKSLGAIEKMRRKRPAPKVRRRPPGWSALTSAR